MTETSPFVAGARVALEGYGNWREDFVLKVYKSGNFYPEKPPHRNSGDLNNRITTNVGRHAKPGRASSWDRDQLYLWDAQTEAQIAAGIALTERRNRLVTIRKSIERLKPEATTDAMLDQIEAALALPVQPVTEG
jgi:hypothetical protein